MKHILLILSFLLSCLFSDGNAGSPKSEGIPSAVMEAAEQGQSEQNLNYDSPALLPLQTARFSGEDTNFTSSVRSTNSGRRTQVSQKSPFRIVKAGKVIDRRNFLDFISELHKFQCGIYSTSRYIHTICHLLI